MDWAQIIITLLIILLVLFAAVIVGLVIMAVRLTLQIRSLAKSTHNTMEAISRAAILASNMAHLKRTFQTFIRQAVRFKKTQGRRKDE